MSRRCADLLCAALDLPLTERRHFVEQASVDDPVLLNTLLKLLQLDAIDSVLDAPLDQLAANLLVDNEDANDAVDDMAAGELIGAWRLLSKLGSGGMGSVWLAERADGEYSQQVALKAIKLGMDTAAVLAQFRRERNLLARLNHPNIASLIDGGVDARGRPWFAMDHVNGTSLNDWIKKQPSLRARLRLFEKLCHAVAHAHQQLVIHRDIKPSNVLVQADGEPKLLDFGIAKLLEDDDSAHTTTMHQFASRNYAAPEQLRGDPVSTATDVYALGALLFELLTGKRYSSVHQQHTGATRPSSLNAGPANGDTTLPRALLRGDLDAIVARALAEEPARRYPSVLSLAEDIHCYLSGQPVRARADSHWYRLRKLVARNRVASLAIVAGLLALVIGLGVSMRQTARAEQQAQRAQAVTKYLTGLFDASRSDAGGIAVRDRSVGDLLEDSATHLRSQLAQQPDLRDELYTLLVEIFDSSDQPKRSIALAQERLESAEAAWGNNDVRLAPALVMLAGVSINHHQLASVPALLQRAEQLLNRAHEGDTMTRAQLWRWQGFYTYTVEDSPVYAGNPLIKAVALLRRDYPDSDELLATLFQLSALAVADRKHAPTQTIIEELRQRAMKYYGAYNVYSMMADFNEANLYYINSEYAKAYAKGTNTLPIVRKFRGEHHHDIYTFQQLRILALIGAKRMPEARSLWTEVDAQRQIDWPNDEALRSTYASLSKKIK